MSGGDVNASPGRHIQIEGGPAFDVGASEDALLRGALRAGLAFPYECSVGGCGACRFELLEGEVATLWEGAPGLSERDRKRGKRLACQSRPLSDCRIRVRLGAPDPEPVIRPRRVAATLTSRRAVSPDMAEFSFELGASAPFRAGQYAVLHLPGVEGVRAYSMSHIGGEDGCWRFIVRKVPGGRGSLSLFEQLEPGMRVDIDGPFGLAHLRPGEREVVCVAGGSGLGPMLSVARGVLAEASPRRLHFFLGLRSEAELSAADELQALESPRLDTRIVLSEPSDPAAWHGPVGFVHTDVERVLPQPLTQYDFYFAGPPRMVEALQEMLMLRHRVPFEQIHFDRFV